MEALQPIDLTIHAHEFVALVGPSGCGKSTILNLIAGLLQPSGGVVSYDGTVVTGPNRRVGYMTQKDTLLPWRTAADNVRIALELRCRSVPRREADARVAQIIESCRSDRISNTITRQSCRAACASASVSLGR